MGSRLLAPAYSLVLALTIGGRLVQPGCLLLRDAVATPLSYLTDSALGLGDTAPRAVPQDAALAVLSHVLDGCVVVKIMLIAALWLAGWGAARMVTAVLDVGVAEGLVATTVTVWNPYVAERLLQGHWSLLVGYAALPWTVCACLRLRAGHGWPAWCALALCLAAAGITPTGALLATVIALVTVGPRRIPGVLGLTVVASAPWLVASLLGTGGASDPSGVAAFAARAEPGLGTLGSLAGLGGIWNADAVPGSRTSWFALVATVALLVVVALGIPTLWRRRDLWGLAVLGGVALGLTALAATPSGLRTLEWLVANVPGAGLLRDTQKWVALAVPVYAIAAAAGCRAVGARVGSITGTAVALCALVVVVLPDLIWPSALRPVTYPPGWAQVAAAVQDSPGDVAVLPAGMFRVFDWAGETPVLDPAPRLLPADVLQTGDLVVRGKTVHGEGTRATAVQQLLLDGADPAGLADLGVSWVLVERSPGPLGESRRTLDGLDLVFSDDELTLYRVPGVTQRDTTDGGITIAAHLLWAALLAGGLAGVVVAGIRQRRADQA
ncbi:MAG TPA: hypothetical protein VIW24_18630 [Aldersonia sp.]